MGTKIAAVIILIITVGGVTLNTVVLDRMIGEKLVAAEALTISDEAPGASEKAVALAYEDFKRAERYISLTVNHDDLTNIEQLFAELIGHLSVGDTDSARVTKNRLVDALCHLRRLSGFNIDSVI